MVASFSRCGFVPQHLRKKVVDVRCMWGPRDVGQGSLKLFPYLASRELVTVSDEDAAHHKIVDRQIIWVQIPQSSGRDA